MRIKRLLLLLCSHAQWERLPGYSNVRDGLIVCITHCLLFFQSSSLHWLHCCFYSQQFTLSNSQNSLAHLNLVISFGFKIHLWCRPQVSIVSETFVFLIYFVCWTKHVHKPSHICCVCIFKTSSNYFKIIAQDNIIIGTEAFDRDIWPLCTAE